MTTALSIIIPPHMEMPGAETENLLETAFEAPEEGGFLGLEYPAKIEDNCVTSRVDAPDYAYTNATLAVKKFAEVSRSSFEVLSAPSDSELLLAEVKRHALPGMLMQEDPELNRIFAEAMEGVALPSDAAAKSAFLQHLQRPVTRLHRDLLNSLAAHMPASRGDASEPFSHNPSIAETWRSLRPLIDICMASSDPVQYAAFLDRHVRSPMVFLELAPLYAEGLVSLELKPLSHEAKQARTVFGVGIRVLRASPDTLIKLLLKVAETVGLDTDDVSTLDGVYSMAYQFVRKQDRKALTRMIHAEVVRGRLSTGTEKRSIEATLNDYRFIEAIGLFPYRHSSDKPEQLLPFTHSFSLGRFPYGLSGLVFQQGVLPDAGGPYYLQFGPASDMWMVHVSGDSYSEMSLHLWRAFEMRLGLLDEPDAECAPEKAFNLEVESTFMAIAGSMAYSNSDVDNEDVLGRLRFTRGKDAVFEATRKSLFDAFQRVRLDDAEAIRSRARELVNAAYKRAFGLTADELFAPFRRGK